MVRLTPKEFKQERRRLNYLNIHSIIKKISLPLGYRAQDLGLFNHYLAMAMCSGSKRDDTTITVLFICRM